MLLLTAIAEDTKTLNCLFFSIFQDSRTQKTKKDVKIGGKCKEDWRGREDTRRTEKTFYFCANHFESSQYVNADKYRLVENAGEKGTTHSYSSNITKEGGNITGLHCF